MERFIRSLVCGVAVVGAADSSANASGNITALGLAPPNSTYAYGLSSDGSVAAGQMISYPGSVYSAFRWTAGTGSVSLGDLPGGIDQSTATDVSGDGSIVVGSGTSASGTEAFRWTAGTGMVGLGDLPGSSFRSVAQGISGDGSTIVGNSRSTNSGSLNSEAFRWTSAGGMVGLGDLPGGSFDSIAWDVSNDGSVIVGSGRAASGVNAFRWTSGTGMVSLGTLPGGTGASHGLGVSSDGLTVVGDSNSASGTQAFRWTSGGGMVGLGDLAGGSFLSTAYGASADGSVIVGTGNTDLGDEAFIWTADEGMMRLKDALWIRGVDALTYGWSRLVEAREVSNDGTMIAGYGIHDGREEAFVVTLGDILNPRPEIPEPTSLALLVPATAATLLARRRQVSRT